MSRSKEHVMKTQGVSGVCISLFSATIVCKYAAEHIKVTAQQSYQALGDMRETRWLQPQGENFLGDMV